MLPHFLIFSLNRMRALSIAAALLFVPLMSFATERLLPQKETDTSVSVNVSTGGCTTKENFSIARVTAGSPAVVVLKRNTPDRCKGWFPEGTWLDFRKDELGLGRSSSVQFFEESAPPAK